jgi:hypothetical protein
MRKKIFGMIAIPLESMNSRTHDRLKALELKLAPKARALVFVFFGNGESSSAQQLVAFKAEHGIGPSDPIHEVIVSFCEGAS